MLAHELVKKGVLRSKIAFAFGRVGESQHEIAEAQGYIRQAGYRILDGTVPEKIAYRRASDEGRTLTETRFASLNERGDQLAQNIIDLVTRLHKRKAA